MGKAAKIKKNIERKVAKHEVKSDINTFREQGVKEEVEELNDDEYYQLFDNDDKPLFKGNFMQGSIIKIMYNGE